MAQQHPSITAYRERQARRRRGKKRRQLLRVAIIFFCTVAVGAAFWALLLLATGMRGGGAQSVPAVSVAQVAPPVSASVAPVASSAPPEDTSAPFYEAGLPLLCNADNLIPDDYAPVFASFTAGGLSATLVDRASEAYQAMHQAAEADGVYLRPVSTYRAPARQVELYTASVNRYLQQGYGQAEAERLTRRYYALPGTSEHEAGLAVDVGDANAVWTDIQDSFEQTDAFAWLQEHAVEYGFIMRYPGTAEEITGIAYEPWHYRYVGSNHAGRIKEQGITLEEYMAQQAA